MSDNGLYIAEIDPNSDKFGQVPEIDQYNNNTENNSELNLLNFNINGSSLISVSDEDLYQKYRNILQGDEEKIITDKIWIRRIKLTLILRHFPQTLHKIKMLLSKLAAVSNLDLHDMALEIVITGLLHKIKEYQILMNSNSINQDNRSQIIKALKEAAAIKEHLRIAEEKNMLDTLMPIFQNRGVEGFEQWCSENFWNAEEFYQLHKESLSKMKWARRAKEWIKFEVLRLSEPMPIDDFLSLAKSQGIIDEHETNKSSFYQHISRLGYLNNPYGHVFDADDSDNE